MSASRQRIWSLFYNVSAGCKAVPTNLLILVFIISRPINIFWPTALIFLVFVQSCLMLMKLWLQSKIKVLEMIFYPIYFFHFSTNAIFSNFVKRLKRKRDGEKNQGSSELNPTHASFYFYGQLSRWWTWGYRLCSYFVWVIWLPCWHCLLALLAGTACLWTSTFTTA